MNGDDLVRVAGKYADMLSAEYAPRRSDGTRRPDVRTTLGHALWMCCEIPAIVAAEKTEKAHRWLGFVQATLWTCGVMTIPQMKDDNR